MIETIVESIRVSLVTQARVVILKEVEGERHLPIWIGPFEAEAIAMELQSIQSSRPLPYDLLRSVIGELGAEVQRIVITEISNDVFYARIVLDTRGSSVEIDSAIAGGSRFLFATDSTIIGVASAGAATRASLAW